MTKILNHINTYQSEADYQNDNSKNFPNVSYIEEDDIVLFLKEKVDYSKDYLTFVALEDGTFKFTGTSSNSLSYSLDDGTTWTALASGVASPTVTSGSKIMWKGITTPNISGIGNFSATGNFDVQGNVMSLLFDDEFSNQTHLSKVYAFYELFYGNTKVVNAKNLILPATTLTSNCYYEMFRGCTSLITAPALPATRLVSNCYYGMFINCTSLTTAPELPATTLANSCYTSMFNGCTNLVKAPSVLPATTLLKECYSAMFYNCTSLTTAPELPATTLVNNCYKYMFQGCRSLNYIKAMFTTTPDYLYTLNWVSGVATTGTFVKNGAAEWNVTGVNGIPSGWTVQDTNS